jgi:hypothetical protein
MPLSDSFSRVNQEDHLKVNVVVGLNLVHSVSLAVGTDGVVGYTGVGAVVVGWGVGVVVVVDVVDVVVK